MHWQRFRLWFPCQSINTFHLFNLARSHLNIHVAKLAPSHQHASFEAGYETIIMVDRTVEATAYFLRCPAATARRSCSSLPNITMACAPSASFSCRQTQETVRHIATRLVGAARKERR